MPFVYLTAAAFFAFAVISLFWDYRIGLIELSVCAVLTLVWAIKFRTLTKDLKLLVQNVAASVSAADRQALESFPLPTVLVSRGGEVIYYNEHFQNVVLLDAEGYGKLLKTWVKGLKSDAFSGADSSGQLKTGIPVSSGDRRFTVFGSVQPNGCCQLYFIDDTKLKYAVSEYEQSRPVVAIIMIDNYDELMQNAKEGEKAETLSQIERQLTAWVSGTNGFMRHSDRDKYIFVFEERHYRKIVEKRFDVLDKVRKIVVDEHLPATLSIGVGRGGATFSEEEEMARQALDMALGRGGDQAAVKSPSGYEFYGGVSKAVEKQTKVKTRIISSALSELIDNSDNVLIMGHKGTDLDTLGAAAGIYKAATSRGHDARIVLSRKSSMAQKLISYLEENGYEDVFVEPDESLFLVTPKTLLVVVDTHRKGYVEYPELYRAVKTVVVIDHHRKMVDFIDNAVVFYAEPYASSASEMVSELLPYMADKSVSPVEASALLAGMTLDTRNFTIRTGVRTFEAAAYLRRKGADIAMVKRLFSGSMDDYRRRARIVSSAEVYRGCAIAKNQGEYSDNMRLVAPQAADDLLTIAGIMASFVVYETETGVSFSARSMGEMNVQLVMEKLGGGGHLTMAGAQIDGADMLTALKKLKLAIDSYINEKKDRGDSK